MSKYTTREIDNPYELLMHYGFFYDVRESEEKLYPAFKDSTFNILEFAGSVVVCFKDDQPVGLLLYHIAPCLWRQDIRILTQHLLWTQAKTRAVYYLLRHLKKVGEEKADMIFCPIGHATNLKPSSLEKMGFKLLETTYSYEVKNG